jgi:hypothetical protein
LAIPIPHFAIDISIDEAKLNEDTTVAPITPILGRIHSIQPNAKSADETIILLNTSVFILGFFVENGKPLDIQTFLGALIRELCRLSPSNKNFTCTHQRCCTASLRCFIADDPMRSNLKRTKGHSGYFCGNRCIQKGEMINRAVLLRNVKAPLRTDADFLTYYVNDYSIDEYLKDPNDLSPFLKLNFPMVSGFAFDPMHIVIEGAFGRRLESFVSVPGEGKLRSTQIAEANQRIKFFRLCRPYGFDRYVDKLEKSKNFKIHVKFNILYYLCFISLIEFWMKMN